MVKKKSIVFFGTLIMQLLMAVLPGIPFNTAAQSKNTTTVTAREKISINDGWKFMRYTGEPDKLEYDERPKVVNRNDNIVADTKPADSALAASSSKSLKQWILPSANDFIKDTAAWHKRPAGDPGNDFPFVQNNFNDNAWEQVNLPHDWAIKGPFYTEANAVVGGGMGRLPVQGVAWYRRKLVIPANDAGKQIYLDIDGAMSYAMVWLNGHLLGGWPYGYTSFRLDCTPFLQPGADNQLAIRLDNPANSSRWYPGGGIYRNVWLTKLQPVHVANWGSRITATNVSAAAATIELDLGIENKSAANQTIETITDIYILQSKSGGVGKKVAGFSRQQAQVGAGKKITLRQSLILHHPLLWGPLPQQYPNLYRAVTRIYSQGKLLDEYETRFGIRSVQFDPVKGLLVNEKPVRLQGVNQHHDLGALGAAFNTRAAERQLVILRDLGCNSIRMAHNPPAPELLNLTDSMGFLVIDEIFDCWEKGKTPLDFHLIFPDWHEADTRAFIRRDKNHPSVIAWSFGNEVGEQYTAEAGAAVAKKIYAIVKDEDPVRPATASMNYARPDMPFPAVMDIISLNYQGEGIRDAPAYEHLKGIRTTPLYPAFKEKFPDKFIFSSETSSALSTRGTYLFPVSAGLGAPVSEATGGNAQLQQVSAYELYTAAFGASPDKVFGSQDKHPYVAGEFVWSGFDYLGEPTPYYSARSSYSGIIDLAGFKKDRFYIYQARWRPSLRMAHILPHWTWPGGEGAITPVHVFSSGDEAELFLNNISLGKKSKGLYDYRFRWDSVLYQPGTLRVVTYRHGAVWAADTVQTAGDAAKLELVADRNSIHAGAADLVFITVHVLDKKGVPVPMAANRIRYELSGDGEIVATDNGDPADLESFASSERRAYSGKALVIIRAHTGAKGRLTVKAQSPGLTTAQATVTIK